MNISERKNYLETVTKKTREGIPLVWNELSLAIEGRNTNLRIWIGNEKSIADGCGVLLIHMRLDKFEAYSTPLSEKSYVYLEKDNEIIKQLLKFEFGTSIDNLDEILRITEKLPERKCKIW